MAWVPENIIAELPNNARHFCILNAHLNVFLTVQDLAHKRVHGRGASVVYLLSSLQHATVDCPRPRGYEATRHLIG